MNSFCRIARQLSTALDQYATLVGQYLSWLALLMALTVVGVVVSRKVLGIGSVAAQESIVYMHAVLIMLASAYTLLKDGHVRVDIFYRLMNPHQKAWVNGLGSVFFLLPTALAITLVAWGFVTEAWSNLEASADAGGLPAVFLLKTVLVLNSLSLILQAVSETFKSLVILTQTDGEKLING